MSKTSATVKNRWNAEHYDVIRITVPKGDKDKIKAAADASGQSVTAFIVDAIKRSMDELAARHGGD